MNLGLPPSLVVLLSFLVAPPVEPETIQADRQSLRQAGQADDAASLLDFFRKRIVSGTTQTAIAGLIEQLGATDYASREKAGAELLKLDGQARNKLLQAREHRDPEIRKRVKDLLQKIGSEAQESKLYGPAARVLAWRKTEGAFGVLLDFLPHIEDPDTVEEITLALSSLARNVQGQWDPRLEPALQDRDLQKRRAAASTLARAGRAEDLPRIRKLMEDADPGVKRQVATALVERREKEAVPFLIDLLTGPASDARAAEARLLAIAGDLAPGYPPNGVADPAGVYQKAWRKWWSENAEKIDWNTVDFHSTGKGYLLVATMSDTRTTSGVLMELDPAGNVRWKIEGLNYPVYASYAGRDRVLICEYYSNRVTERDSKGRIYWTRPVSNQVLSADRLPNGNTFICTRNQLLEVDRDGKEVKSITRPFDVLAAHRHRNGHFTLLTTNGNCLALDPSGKQLSAFNVGFRGGTIGFRAQFLPKGGLLVPDYARGRILEYDSQGKIVWEVAAFRPNAVLKLPNGNVLFASRARNRITEIDSRGNEVSNRPIQGRPMFLDRR